MPKATKPRQSFKNSESGSWDGWAYTIQKPNEQGKSTVRFVDVDNELGIEKAKQILRAHYPGKNYKLIKKGKLKRTKWDEEGPSKNTYIFDV